MGKTTRRGGTRLRRNEHDVIADIPRTCREGVRRVADALRVTEVTEAGRLSISENIHYENIPEQNWANAVLKLYKMFEGSKEKRIEKICKMTGLSQTVIQDYLILASKRPSSKRERRICNEK